jgi:hypothetical protein
VTFELVSEHERVLTAIPRGVRGHALYEAWRKLPG